MKTEILTACDQAVAATANGVYQGVLLTLLVALGLRWWGRTNAATRHSIWMSTLLLLPGIIAAHYCLDHRHADPQSLTSARQASNEILMVKPSGRGWREQLGRAEDMVILPAAQPRESSSSKNTEDRLSQPAEIHRTLSEPPVPWTTSPSPAGAGAVPASATASTPSEVEFSLVSVDQPWLRDLPTRIGQSLRLAAARLTEPLYWTPSLTRAVPRTASLALLGALMLIACFRLGQLACRLYQLRIHKLSSAPADAAQSDLFHRLVTRLRLRRPVTLRVSGAHRSPVVLGFFHPVVLMPSAEVLPTDSSEVEQILRHELAHVLRRDDWANLVQHFLQAVLFFHPAVWWVGRRLSLEREIACDDQVLQQGGQPKAYALILANLASRMKRCAPLLAPGASANKSQLQQRIDMILDTKRNTSPHLAKTRLGFVTSAAALLAVLAIYSGPRLVLAQTATAPAADTAPYAGAAVANNAAPEAAPADTITVAQAEDPTAPGPDGDSGPRYKIDALPAQRAPAAGIPAPPMAPNPPVAVVTPVPPGAPAIVVAPHPMALTPAPGTSGYAIVASGHGSDDSSLERRLERVERMVQSLMAQQDGAHVTPGQPMPKGPNWNLNWKMDEKQMAEMKARAERDAARAEKEAKRAAEEFKRANKEMDQARKDHPDLARGPQKDGAQRQLEALRRARENLERQMQKLDNQIEKLEQDQEKLQEEQERRSELQEDQGAKEEPAVAQAETE